MFNSVPKFNESNYSMELIAKHDITRDDQMKCQLSYSKCERQHFLGEFIDQKLQAEVTASLATTAQKIARLGTATDNESGFHHTTDRLRHFRRIQIFEDNSEWDNSANVKLMKNEKQLNVVGSEYPIPEHQE